MTLASIDAPSRTSSAAKNDALALKNGQDTRSETSEFGQVMSEIMPPHGRHDPMGAGSAADPASGLAAETPPLQGQGLADAPLGLAVANALGGDFLKAVHLGPHLNVITAETAVPDEQSLEAFARSQGLDETAVQWLMGTAPGLATALPPASLTATQEGGALTITGTVTGAGTNMLTASGDGLATGDVAQPDMTNGRAPVNSAALTAAALWAMAQPTDKARTATPTPEATAETSAVAIAMQTPAAPAAVWMLRHAQAVAPGKEAATNKTGIAESELDLSEAASPELLESLGIAELGAESGAEGGAASAGAHPTPLSGHHAQRHDHAASARLDAANADTSAAAPESGTAQQRSNNVQNLAEKMGQAVGQRILSEIEKGQWHLKLSLRPATLGHIEVEMRMRSGELDAVFTASQAVTRELLQDGMSKLKDTLNQMGMDVASFQVGDGQTQQRGGESTPGQMSKSTNTGKPETPTPMTPPAVTPPRMKMGQDGWDVLV